MGKVYRGPASSIARAGPGVAERMAAGRASMQPLVLSPPRSAMTPEEIRMSKAIRLPICFLRSLTPDEVCTLVLRNRWLDEKQCARLWRMMGREDEPPYTVRVYVSQTDVDVLIEQIHAMALRSAPQRRFRTPSAGHD
jgi:hypothetical protein